MTNGTWSGWGVSVTPRSLFTHRERRVIHCTVGWMGASAGLETCRKSGCNRDSIPGPSIPVASRYTDYSSRPTDYRHDLTFPQSLYITNPSGQNFDWIPKSGGSTNVFFSCVVSATEVTKLETTFERNRCRHVWDSARNKLRDLLTISFAYKSDPFSLRGEKHQTNNTVSRQIQQVSMAQCSACVMTRQQIQASMVQCTAGVMTRQHNLVSMLQYTTSVKTYKQQQVTSTL
jgi:hypothetical protein